MKFPVVVAGIIALALVACAPAAKQRSVSVTPDLPDGFAESVVLATDAVVRSSAGYASKLKQGTTWEFFGKIPEGLVYKPRDTVFTVEAANVSEAYMVLHDRTFVGFYLPVQQTFSPAGEKVLLEIVPGRK